MAHMIMENDSMFSASGIVPWHRLPCCKVIQDAPNAEEAIKIAGLEWKVVQVPLYIGSASSNNKLKSIEDDELVATVREDTNQRLGIVSKKYKIIQNNEIFNFMDNLLDQGAKFETAGSLENGKRVWMLARLESYNILGDDYDNYFLCSTSHDGRSGLVGANVSVRVVCSNTEALALKTAKRTWTMQHRGQDMDSKLLEATKALSFNNQYVLALKDYAQGLSEKIISDSEFEAFLNELFPISVEDSNRVKANMTKLQNDFITCYNEPNISQFKNTGWGIANAITDFAFHSTPLRSSSLFEEKRMGYVIDGHPFIDKAMKILEKV